MSGNQSDHAPHNPTLMAADRDSMARLLGMLGSDPGGEVFDAGRLADRLVRSRGATWADVIAPAIKAPASPPPPYRPHQWQRAAYLCREAPSWCVTRWEKAFAAEIGTHRRRPSDRQLDILRVVTVRVILARDGAA